MVGGVEEKKGILLIVEGETEEKKKHEKEPEDPGKETERGKVPKGEV